MKTDDFQPIKPEIFSPEEVRELVTGAQQFLPPTPDEKDGELLDQSPPPENS